jgi:sigma-E factor negative regulatory protein RseB
MTESKPVLTAAVQSSVPRSSVPKPARRLRWTFVFCAGVSAAAFANPNLEPMQWLQKIQQAAQKLNYSGSFVYLQQGSQPQSSRITHFLDGGVEKERLEMLEGAPLVIVRSNDEVKTYLPESKTILIEKRRAKPGFPALIAPLPANSNSTLSSPAAAGGAASASISPVNPLNSIAEQYTVRKWDTQRIAGLDCQVLLLEPKDGLRYTHKLWADVNSGLLLKAQTFNEKSEVVEQIAFTQVEIGGVIEKYQARFQQRDGGREWRTASAQVWDASLAEAGWKIEPALPGFRKISEMRRGMVDGAAVGQVVFSDGLSSVSVFVEPVRDGARVREGVSTQGAVNIYRRKVADHLVTVLGEAPAACVTRIGKSVEFKPVIATNRSTP